MAKRRRFWSDEEKRRIVDQARLPVVSVSPVARRSDVNATLVFKWLRDPRFQVLAGPAAFLPLEVVQDVAPAVDRPGSEASQVAIELANGHRLILSGCFDPDRVVRLVHGLTS